MLRRALFPPAICVVTLAGCTYSPLFLIEESSLRRDLPSDVSMSDYVEKDWFGNKVTVAEKLARLGAYTEGDKIRDGTGQEIRFIKHEDYSLKASPEMLKQEQQKVLELKKHFTVIEVQRDPGPAPPAPTLVSGPGSSKPPSSPPPTVVSVKGTPPGAAKTQPETTNQAGGNWQPADTPPAATPAVAPVAQPPAPPAPPTVTPSAMSGWQAAK